MGKDGKSSFIIPYMKYVDIDFIFICSDDDTERWQEIFVDFRKGDTLIHLLCEKGGTLSQKKGFNFVKVGSIIGVFLQRVAALMYSIVRVPEVARLYRDRVNERGCSVVPARAQQFWLNIQYFYFWKHQL